MKKTIFIFCTAVWLLLGAIFVYADDEGEIAAYYLDDEVIYTYSALNIYPEKTAAEIKLIDRDAAKTEAAPVMKSDTTVRYLLLVDGSKAMRKHKEEVNELAKALIEANKTKNTKYTIAYFGTEYHKPNDDYHKAYDTLCR